MTTTSGKGFYPIASRTIIPVDLIYLDTTYGFEGTEWPIGTPARPVKSLEDLLVILGQRNSINIHVKNELVLDRNLPKALNFFGDGDWYQSRINFNGKDIAGSNFRGLNLYGIALGMVYAQSCILGDNSPGSVILSGNIYECPIVGIEVPLGFSTAIYRCSFGSTIDITGGQLYIVDSSGDLDVRSMTGVMPVLSVLRGDHDILLEAGCVAGGAYITGNNHRLTDKSAGTVVFDYTDYLKPEVPVNMSAIAASELPVIYLPAVPDIYGYTPRITVKKLRIKCADPGAETVTVRLYELINNVPTNVRSFDITQGAPNPYTTYYGLEDMFGTKELNGSQLIVTVQATGMLPIAVTGSYVYKMA